MEAKRFKESGGDVMADMMDLLDDKVGSLPKTLID